LLSIAIAVVLQDAEDRGGSAAAWLQVAGCGESGLTQGNCAECGDAADEECPGLPKWKVALMIGCAASIVGIACAVAALVFGLALADRNHKLASTSTARTETGAGRARTATQGRRRRQSPRLLPPPGRRCRSDPHAQPDTAAHSTRHLYACPANRHATRRRRAPPGRRAPAPSDATPAPTAPPLRPRHPAAARAAVLGEPTDFSGIWDLQTFTWTPAGRWPQTSITWCTCASSATCGQRRTAWGSRSRSRL